MTKKQALNALEIMEQLLEIGLSRKTIHRNYEYDSFDIDRDTLRIRYRDYHGDRETDIFSIDQLLMSNEEWTAEIERKKEAARLAQEKRKQASLDEKRERRYNEFLKLQKEFETND